MLDDYIYIYIYILVVPLRVQRLVPDQRGALDDPGPGRRVGVEGEAHA